MRKKLFVKKKVVCIGISVLDILIANVDTDILLRETSDVDYIGCLPGGDALNESVILASLGHDSQLMGTVGDDMWGSYILSQLNSRGVNTSSMYAAPSKSTTVSVVLVKRDSERSFLVNKAGSAAFDEKCLNFEDIKSADALSIGSVYYHESLDSRIKDILLAAKENRALTFGDVSYREGYTLDKARDFLGLFDYLLPNYDEASGLTGKTDLDDIADTIMDYGVKNVIIKIGERGCYIKNAEGSYTVPAFKTDTVIDTTGAGDSFAAGLIAALLEGSDLKTAAIFANAAASVTVRGIGATVLHSRSEVDEVMSMRLECC